MPIWYMHVGKPLFLDNKFGRNQNDTIGKKLDLTKTKVTDFMLPAVITYGSWFRTTLGIVSIGNSYYYNVPFHQSPRMPHKNYVSGDQFGKDMTGSGDSFVKKMPATPKYTERKIFEVRPGTGSDAIQAIINQAAASGGKRAVIHFPFGIYSITKTLVIPAGSDLQIIGDGPSLFLHHSTAKPFQLYRKRAGRG